MSIKSLADARAIAGRLGTPSKMPGMCYGLPARACKVGSKLNKLEGTTCSKCYALKGNYNFPVVLRGQQKRLESIEHPDWVEAMSYMIATAPAPRRKHFRWHDSGDLQSIEHLEKIVEVAKRLPKIRFWMPTREQGILTAYLAQFGELPENLVVRVSAAMIDGKPPAQFKLTSGVHKDEAPKGYSCPAKKYGNTCGPCRACWDPKVAHVSYAYH